MGNPFKSIEWLTTKVKPEEVETPEDGYNSFIINRHFSYFPDLIFVANEMNMRQNATSDASMQFAFYFNFLKKQKRFSKWAKPKADEKIKLIMEFYSYSREKATDVADLFDDTKIKELRQQLQKGGLKANK